MLKSLRIISMAFYVLITLTVVNGFLALEASAQNQMSPDQRSGMEEAESRAATNLEYIRLTEEEGLTPEQAQAVIDGKAVELNVDLGEGKSVSTEGGATGILTRYVSMIFNYAAGLIIVVAVIMIIIGGFEVMFKGSSGDISTGKDRISQALLGIVMVFLTGLFLHTINPAFFSFG
jgi:hypothetical protein